MSFVGLWDSFDSVNDYWLETRNLLETFMHFTKEKSEIDAQYAKKINKLASHTFFSIRKNTFAPVVEHLQKMLTQIV